MATRGTTPKSATGASMSKYDVEVEARLKALEAKASTPSAASGGDAERIAELEAKVDDLIVRLRKKMSF